MKLKNIPVDIKKKSIQEAQNELEEIVSYLEKNEVILENSLDKYTRMMQLHHYIGESFKKKASEINKILLDKSKKISLKEFK